MTRMRVAISIIILAVIVVGVWIAHNTYWDEVTLPMPPTGEAAENPFYAAQRFAEQLGATTQYARGLRALPDASVIVLSFWHWSIDGERREMLERWVESGGRLVIDGSLASGEAALEQWAGISRRQVRSEPEEEPELPASAFDLLSGKFNCAKLRETRRGGREQTDAREIEVCELNPASSLTSSRPMDWTLRNDSGNQALRVRIGDGSVTMINATPFIYRSLLNADHGVLFVAATQLRRGDSILFLTENTYPSILSLAWAHGAPVICLALGFIALALWRGGVRFGPLVPPPESARRSLAEQIRGTGLFVLRYGGGEALHAATVRALSEAAQRRIPAFTRMSSEDRAAALARLTGFDAHALAAASDYSRSRRSNELRSSIALLEAARRRLLLENRRSVHGN